jgi:hypothetical protein
MDWPFIKELFKGVFFSFNNIIQSLPAWIGIGSFIVLSCFPILGTKMKDKLPGIRKYATHILLGFILISVILTSYSLYEDKQQKVNGLQSSLTSLQQERDGLKAKLSDSQENQTQWYLKFKETEVFPDHDENGDPIEMPFRVISIINGQRYSYPTDSVLIRQGTKIEDSFPIPIDIKPPYRIKFEGILMRGDKQVPLKSTKEDVYQTYQLPIEKCEYEVFADSSIIARPDASKFVVHYEIINYQEKNK